MPKNWRIMLIVLGIKVEFSKPCVPAGVSAERFEGSEGQIVALVAHELKRRGISLDVAGTESVTGVGIIGEGLSEFQAVIQMPEIHALRQAAKMESTSFVQLDKGAQALTDAIRQRRQVQILGGYVERANMRDDVHGAKILKQQQQIVRAKMQYGITHIAGEIPGESFEQKLKNYITGVLDKRTRRYLADGSTATENS